MRPIRSEAQYNRVLARIEALWGAPTNTSRGDELDVLLLLAEDYARKHYPIPPPTPIEAIEFRMEQLGLQSKDLAEYLGYKSSASEILGGKRKLTLPMIRNLYEKLGIPASTLIQSY